MTLLSYPAFWLLTLSRSFLSPQSSLLFIYLHREDNALSASVPSLVGFAHGRLIFRLRVLFASSLSLPAIWFCVSCHGNAVCGTATGRSDAAGRSARPRRRGAGGESPGGAARACGPARPRRAAGVGVGPPPSHKLRSRGRRCGMRSRPRPRPWPAPRAPRPPPTCVQTVEAPPPACGGGGGSVYYFLAPQPSGCETPAQGGAANLENRILRSRRSKRQTS